MAEVTRGERLQIMLTDDELEALDTWRFAQRMPSRASAVRELLRRGLVAEGFARPGAGAKSSSSPKTPVRTTARSSGPRRNRSSNWGMSDMRPDYIPAPGWRTRLAWAQPPSYN